MNISTFSQLLKNGEESQWKATTDDIFQTSSQQLMENILLYFTHVVEDPSFTTIKGFIASFF